MKRIVGDFIFRVKTFIAGGRRIIWCRVLNLTIGINHFSYLVGKSSCKKLFRVPENRRIDLCREKQKARASR